MQLIQLSLNIIEKEDKIILQNFMGLVHPVNKITIKEISLSLHYIKGNF